MAKPFDYLVFIGRFQPFHKGHLAVVQQALNASEHLLILCGSASQPVSTHNPWTVEQVDAMIRSTLRPAESARVQILPVQDVLYNENRWISSVQRAVADQVGDTKKRVGLVGLNRNGQRFYLNRFPHLDSVGVEEVAGIRSTPIREALFDIAPIDGASGPAYLTSEHAVSQLPDAVRQWLLSYGETDAYTALREEADFIAKYRSAWRAAPYPPTFITVDAVVVQSGHILLVERKAFPGKGLHALPGGFVGPDECLEASCIRELREETRLKVPAPMLHGSIRARRVFDAPYRSQRGRTITQAFLIELPPAPQLPRVKGGDDARHAFWVPLAELSPEHLFEDHYHIIQAMLC